MDLPTTTFRYPDPPTASPLLAALQDLTQPRKERRPRTLCRSHPDLTGSPRCLPVLRDLTPAAHPTAPATRCRSLRDPTRAPDRPVLIRIRITCRPNRTAAPVIHPVAARVTAVPPSRMRHRVPTTWMPLVRAIPAELPVIPPSARAIRIPVPVTPVPPGCLTPEILPPTRPCTRVLPVHTGRPQNRAGLIPV